MLEKLSSGLKDALRKIAKSGYIDKATVDELVKDIQRTMLASDVNVKLVFELTEKIKKRALDEKPKSGMTPREHMVNIVYEELVNFVGKKPEIMIRPGKILFVGLFGSGKTTSIGKLAKFYQKKGLRPALIGCDVHRPAAMDQLKQIAEQLNVPYYISKDTKDAVKIARTGLEQLRKNDILIFDSSGRDALDGELAKELKELGKMIQADEVILAIPADLGQAAGKQASEFNKLVGITGIFLTKMDGTARGGGAISACAATNSPVKFIGVGEKLDALEVFEPERFISRLIGFGDLQSLIEKAKEAIEPGKAEEMADKFTSGKFTMEDFYEQLKSMGKMGSLKSIMDMMPGMGGMKLPKGVDLAKQEDKMKKWKFIIESMTKKERADPDLIDSSRITRIAKGSGTQESDVRELIKNYNQSKKMMKMFSGGSMKRGMMSRFAKKFKGM
ncbi:MAG: signal recognition particle receptor subunit alpha [Candidatus Aenigmarchaeota archaeon]|nr:signal recognition particle receptor subunit alpha [Candidatus Aenigmarchaeota archaeon]